MLIIYNILQLLALLVLGPFLLPWVCLAAKYRRRIPRRLGLGLAGLVRGLRPGPRIWVHALSVGEVASARPLLQMLRHEMPEAVLILSSTTSGGEAYARRLAGVVDCLVPFPLDLFWVVARFVRVLRPDLFVLVETDFWPNLLSRLGRERVPCLLANGRITMASMARYQRLRFLFAPLFNTFAKISMQMADDARSLTRLGVAPEKIVVCGNLKYDMAESAERAGVALDLAGCGLHGRPLLVAGSTHEGEEAILVEAFAKLCKKFPAMGMIIAPRSVERAPAIVPLAVKQGLDCALRTARGIKACQVLVLDTLGELAQVYRQADIAFVGGSLVREGGHNPLEPAYFGKPVLFGADMSDFLEISRDLLAAGGAKIVTAETLCAVMDDLLSNDEKRRQIGGLARELVVLHQGAARRYLELIRGLVRHAQ